MISDTRSSSTDDSLVKPAESGVAARPIFFKSLFKGHTGLQRQTSDDTAKTTDADGLSVCSEGGNDCNDFDDDLDVAPIKTVSFSSRMKVRGIPRASSYTEEEHKASWYQEDEFYQMRMACVKQIDKINKGMVLKDKKYCSRGLEGHTRLLEISKRQNRRAGFDAVINEQREQRHLGFVDDEAIARKYSDVTSSCQLWARKMALQDQQRATINHRNVRSTIILVLAIRHPP